MILLSTNLMLTISRYSIIPLIVIALLFQAWRITKSHQRPGKTVVQKMMAGTTLLFISALTALVEPRTWMINWVSSVAFHFSIVFTFYAIDQYINNKQRIDILSDRLFRLTLFISILRVWFEYERRNNLASFMDNEHPEFNTNLHLANLLYYVPVLVLLALTTYLYWKNIRQATITPSYVLRRSISMIGFGIATFGFLCLTVAVLLAMFITDEYRRVLTALYHYSKPLMSVFLVAGLSAPNSFFNGLTRPIERAMLKKQHQQYASLLDLMRDYTRIVPCQFYDPSINQSAPYKLPIKRINAAIGDGRLIILSHCSDRPLTAREEAQWLWQLLQSGVTLQSPGNYDPAIAYDNPTRHNLDVARHLRKLQSQQRLKYPVAS